MNVSNAPAPCDAVSLESTRRLFQRVFDRVSSLIADAADANERANAAVKALELLRLESLFFPTSPLDLSDPTGADWRRRVETALDAVAQEISTVESRSERAYLRRLALDATLTLNACAETFFTEPFADALLAEIDDAEERQNALVAYSTRLAERIYRFRQSAAPERVKAFALTEEIEDLRFFESAASNVAAAVILDATRCDDAPFVATDDNATLDLTSFGDDVASVLEQLESPGGFLELCERASSKFFDVVPPVTSATPQEIALRQALNAETRRRLEALLTALDADVDADGAPLDQVVREEFQTVVAEAIIESPFALKNGEFFRAFLERSRNLDAFFPIFKRFAEAENASDAASVSSNSEKTPAPIADATNCRRSFYNISPTQCAEEKTRWLESARHIVAHSAAFEADVDLKTYRLLTYAELEFLFGDKTNGNNAVRETLGLLPRLRSPFKRASIYRRLVKAHILASYPKAAQKLASLWKAELDAISPEDLRDAGLVDAFELYSQAVTFDAAAISAFLDSLAAPLARLECETLFKLQLIYSQPVTTDAIEEIAKIADATLNKIATLDETSPDKAVFTFVKIASAVADALARRSTATTQTPIQ